ncbi:hypothetical protein COEREDRAFT_42841 [Coemansia reversa NRRL 1564]|uniref:FYVE-type domain-containing protein n=1 Tax=Coemansia reversa (strain ATCC 12441 / NRRL 1564) TaxID=763665 RepID=A0A2G5BBG7_COERN|nr:hypothetical protein COEREDRAFT_42841 [Coemansia reversa NRRL 1564]|eukprot:PIA16353.1 hypothetical protein COEREDRAFT_42841 [Coemansia reversa NRRL 1564]
MERTRPTGGLGAEGIQTRYASQDDLEEVKGVILGFFRGAGKAVRGLSGAAQTAPISAASSSYGGESVAADASGSEAWRVGEKDGADRDIVTRTHWQQQRAGVRCGLVGCGISLTPQTGIYNCRSCGRLMCGQHCNRRMRLSPTAQAAGPGRGVACRVCEECHTRATASTVGRTRSHMRGFVHMRRKAVSSTMLEGTRLEKRLEKLALVHGAPGQTGVQGRALQEAEQAVVVWEEDVDVANCPFCAKTFGRVASRRHHCRLCGRVVCGRAGCSALLGVPLPVPGGQGFSASHRADIRACRTCEDVIIRHRDLRASMALVEETLPTFNALATRLGNHAAAPDLPRAARIRRQLTAAFNGMDHASKCIAALPVKDATSTRLHSAIRRTVSQYLQLHMFPLTMLPKPARRPHSLLQSDSSPRAPTPLRVHTAPGTADGSEVDRIAAMPSHEKMSSLDVLRDQRQRVLGYISEAQKDRRLEDAMSLQASLGDLDVELSLIERSL